MVMEPTIVDFVENAFGASVSDIREVIRKRPDEALRRQDDITALLHDAWRGPTLEDNRASEKLGELWPRLPDTVTDVLTIADMRVNSSLRYGRPGAGAEAVTRDIQALLLYAHGLHVPSPLAGRGHEELTSLEFLHGLAQVCSLAPLIRGGVVRVHEPSVAAGSPSHEIAEALEELKRHIGLALLSFEALDNMDQGRLYEAGAALVDRACRVLLEDESGGLQGTILFPTQYDRAALDALTRALTNPSERTAAPTQDILRLDLLQALRLPGLEGLPLNEMVAIRSDESFGVFRTNVTSALTDIDDDVLGGRLDEARRAMAEHMDAGVAQLNGKTRRGILRDITLSNSVEWGIGAALAASLAGLQGLVATLLGGLTVGYTTEAPSAGRRALRRHYVELGTATLARRADPVDFATFSTDELWGHHRGRVGRLERRDAIIEGLLEEFGE